MTDFPENGQKRILVVVAHPDDEVLGFGGAAAMLSNLGVEMTACIASGQVSARQFRPADDELHSDIMRAAELLGMTEPVLGDFPNIGMNAVPHLDLVQFIEDAILRVAPSHVFTHHPADINDDHGKVSMATQAACRLPQRRPGVGRIDSLHFMEIASSTDWSFASASEAFAATSFMEIGEAGLERKLSALANYRDVMRPYPHPRSEESIRALATYRGGQAGMNFAEAFQTVYQNFNFGLLRRV